MDKYSEKLREQIESNSKELFRMLNKADKKNEELQFKLEEIKAYMLETELCYHNLYDDIPSENNKDKLILAENIREELLRIIER